jgi:hypothetical protein
MKWLAIIVWTAIAASGCVASPVAPSSYTCYTQPRGYTNPSTGVTTYEVDHYTQEMPCPRIPIS